MNDQDKQKIIDAVGDPMKKLADKVIGDISGKVAKMKFKKEFGEEMKLLQQYCPKLWSKLPKATHLHFAGVGASKNNQRRVAIEFANYRPLCLPDITNQSANNWGSTGLELVLEDFYPEHEDTITKWNEIAEKQKDGEARLVLWLQQFEEPQQLPFSLPQIMPFLRRIDFRKRRRWSSADVIPMFVPQKRPRMTCVASQELKQYIVESWLLAASTGEAK